MSLGLECVGAAADSHSRPRTTLTPYPLSLCAGRGECPAPTLRSVFPLAKALFGRWDISMVRRNEP